MNTSRFCHGAALALVLAASCAAAQDARPPEGASAEERRAFWQKRAAERAAEGGERPSEAQIAEWRAKRAARDTVEAQPPTTAAAPAEHRPAPAARGPETPPSSTGGKPDKPAAGGRPGGMPMGMRGGSNVLWLSDSPPSRGDGPRRGGMPGMGGMGGMAMGGERTGPPMKRLWLRAGSDPQKSGFARDDAEAQVDMLLVTPQGKPEGESLPVAGDGRAKIAFEMPVQGYYRLYVVTRKLAGDTLNVGVAKAEITNVSHGGTEEERSVALAAPRVLESAPIEIVREKAPDEKLFFQLKSGDEQAFVVLQKGLPVQGARVRFVSHAGWTKEAVSDEQGRVAFQVVRDYFPAWDDFQKRFKATYLVIAEANAAESGSFKDQPYGSVRYQATLSGSYYPSPDDYRSYAWGLGIGFAFLTFCGTAVYLYRRRRVKPFQEVRFDEKN